VLGGCINYEMEVIKRAFEELGIKIIVENEHPPESRNFGDKLANERDEHWEIKLVANHMPWGG
jgi:hypothetical protein